MSIDEKMFGERIENQLATLGLLRRAGEQCRLWRAPKADREAQLKLLDVNIRRTDGAGTCP